MCKILRYFLTYLQQREFQWRHLALRHRNTLNYMALSCWLHWKVFILHYITLKMNTTASDIYFRRSCFVWTPPHHCNWSLFSGTHASYEHRLTTAIEDYFRHSRFVWTPPSCAVGHSISVYALPALASRREKLVIPERFTVKAHPTLFGGESTMMEHYYSSLQLTYTFKTRTKHAKTHKKLELFTVAVLFAAAKLQRVALYVRKFKEANSNTHTPMKDPSRRTCPGGGNVSFGSLKHSRIEPQPRICVTYYTPTRTQSYRRICKCYVTFLLNGEILLFIWTFETKTRPWWPNTLFSGSTATP